MLHATGSAGRVARTGAFVAGLVTVCLWFGSLGLAPLAVRAALNHDRIPVELSYSPADLHVEQPEAKPSGDYPRVRLGDPSSSSVALRDGGRWPAPVVYLAVPEGLAPAGVTVEGSDGVGIPEQPGLQAFDSATDIPTELRAELVYEGWMRGQRVAGVRVHPLVRDAAGRLRLWQTVHVNVELRPGGAPDGTFIPERRGTRTDADFQASLRYLVSNPVDVTDPSPNETVGRGGFGTAAREASLVPSSFNGDGANPLFRPSLDGSPVDMVIITNEAMTAEYQRLADWRTRTGNYTVIRTVSWIAANYPGGIDLADSIRRFIKDAASRWGTGNVLLGGDSDVVPVRYGRTAYFGGEEIPTDLYYQCLDRNWNENGNSEFGEGFNNEGPGGSNNGDDVDLMPDVWVARIPLSTPAGVKAVIDKTFQFERTPPIHKKYIPCVLVLAEMLQPSSWNQGDLVLYDGAELGESAIASFPPNFCVTRMYENYTDPRWSATALPEARAAVIDSLNAGYMIVHHVGHGFRNNVSVGISGLELERHDADALTNKTEPFLFYGINCNSASFDFECIAEHFLGNPNGGAFAYIGSTRFDFPGHGEDYQSAFYNNLFHDHPAVGEAHARQKFVRLADSARDAADRWTQFTLVCLGDPLVQLRSENPQNLAVTYPSTATLGSYLSVTVLRAGAPLAGARVTLYRAPDLFATDTTNAQGMVTLPVPAEQTGVISLTATSLNSVPYEGTVTLTAPGAAPYLRVTALSIVDNPAAASGLVGNNDGHLDPGETANLLFTVQNAGGAAASGVTLTYGSGSGGLTVVNPITDLATVAPDASVSTPTTQTIRVTASAALTAPTTLAGTLTLAWAGGSRVDPVALNVGGVNLWVISQTVVDDPGGPGSDGQVAAGELVQLTPTVKNRGLSVARNVHLKLVTTDARVTLGSADRPLGDMAAGATVVSSPLTFSVSDLAALPAVFFVMESGGIEVARRAVDLSPPAVPGLPIGAPQSTAISLTWLGVTDPELRGYAIYRSDLEAGPFTLLNPIIDNPMSIYLDSGLNGFTRYYYKLAAQDQAGNLSARTATIAAATSFASLPNFPLERAGGTPSSPVIHDLNGDGEPEIVIGGEEIYAIHADGTEYENGDDDSRTLGVLTQTNGATFWGTPAISDIDNDGVLEIVAAGWKDGNLYVFKPNGGVAPGWPKKIADVLVDCGCSGLWASACVVDIDGDKHQEIFIPGGHYLYGFHADGTEIRDGDNNPATVGVFADLGVSYNYGTPAAGDLDGDGIPEVVIGARNGKLHVFKPNGTEPAGWPKEWLVNGVAAPIITSPAIADLDNDHHPEIIVAVQQPRNKVEAINLAGNSPPGWPVGILVNQDFNASATVGDINRDTHLDVVMAGGSGRVQAWRGDNGQPLFNSVDLQALENTPNFILRGTPVLGDITGDGHPDIIVGTNTGAVWGMNESGQILPGFPLRAQDNIEGGAAIWDVDGDQKNELIFGSIDRDLYVFRTQGVFDTTGALPWAMFRHDQANSGNVTRAFTTPVEPALAAFTAQADGDGVRLEWRVGSTEAEPAGWNVYRSEGAGEGRLNAALLPAAARMSFLDDAAMAGAYYTYHIEMIDRTGRATRFAPLSFTVPADGALAGLLRQNAPNPFRAATSLSYHVPAATSPVVAGAAAGVAATAGAAGRLHATSSTASTGSTRVRLEILDIQGRRVRLLVDADQAPGEYSLLWDGRDDHGVDAAGGLYFYRLRVGVKNETRKMLLTR